MLTGKHSRACDNVISLSRAPYPKGNERKYYRISIKPSMMKRAIHFNLSMCMQVFILPSEPIHSCVMDLCNM
jgi:hypothetical protein